MPLPSLNLPWLPAVLLAQHNQLLNTNLSSHAFTIPLAHSIMRSSLLPQDLYTCFSFSFNAPSQTFLWLTLSHPSDLNFLDIPIYCSLLTHQHCEGETVPLSVPQADRAQTEVAFCKSHLETVRL